VQSKGRIREGNKESRREIKKDETNRKEWIG
jgi:hypothetical protein